MSSSPPTSLIETSVVLVLVSFRPRTSSETSVLVPIVSCRVRRRRRRDEHDARPVSLLVLVLVLQCPSRPSPTVYPCAIRPHASTSAVIRRGSLAWGESSWRTRTWKPSSGCTTRWLMGPPSSAVVRPRRVRRRGRGGGRRPSHSGRCGCGCVVAVAILISARQITETTATYQSLGQVGLGPTKNREPRVRVAVFVRV